jgi:hypothetical protein
VGEVERRQQFSRHRKIGTERWRVIDAAQLVDTGVSQRSQPFTCAASNIQNALRLKQFDEYRDRRLGGSKCPTLTVLVVQRAWIAHSSLDRIL